MNRNQENGPESVVRFSRTNPPPSKEAALTRTDLLDEKVTLIETQLEHHSPDSFESEEAYEGWRKRAMDALGFARTERRFLRKWVADRQHEALEAAQRKEKEERRAAEAAQRATRREEAKNAFHPEDGSDLAAIVGQIKGRVRALAEEIGRDYTPIYSAVSLPTDLATAEERLEQLGAIKLRLQGAFAEVVAAWSAHPLHPRALPGVKAPLSKILSGIELELSVLRGYIRTTRAKDPRQDWKTVCFHALERAVAGGFQLTPDEQIVFEQLKALHTLYGAKPGV